LTLQRAINDVRPVRVNMHGLMVVLVYRIEGLRETSLVGLAALP
jgi:hypothetical protein